MSTSQIEIELSAESEVIDGDNEEIIKKSNYDATSLGKKCNEIVLNLQDEKQPDIIEQVLLSKCKNETKIDINEQLAPYVQEDSKFKKQEQALVYEKKPTVWVQFNLMYGNEEPNPAGAPLAYDPHTRNNFVKLVFFILIICLSITIGFVAFVYNSPDLRHFYRRNAFVILLIGLVVVLIAQYSFLCIPGSTVGMCSYVCLVISVAGMSNIAASVTVRYHTSVIWIALVATLVTVFVCFLLACSNFDFTKWFLYAVAIMAVLAALSMIISVITLIMKIHIKPLHLALTALGAIMNVVMIIMQLQMVLGGRTVELTEDSHAFAAYLLYMSIVELFIQLLQLTGAIDS